MQTRRVLLATIGALPLWAADKPSSDRQTALLKEAARLAIAYTLGLPNFVCTQNIRRSDNVNGIGWRVKDYLGVQVGISDRREYYKLLTYNGRPTTLSYRAVGGALTEGEFGSLLADVFRPGAATFRWKRSFLVAGRTVEVFSYRIPLDRATYHLEYGYRTGKQSTLVGHKGEVWIDSQSSRVTRIEQTAEIPKSFPLKVSRTTLDFAWVDIGGEQWLMPRRAGSLMGNYELLTANEVEFTDYRRFSADSAITFEQP